MLENTVRAIKNWQSRETLIGYTRRRQTKQKHNTICVGHYHTQTNTNNVNKTWAHIQTTGGKDEPNVNKTWALLQTTGGKDEPNVNKTWSLLQTTGGKGWLYHVSLLYACILISIPSHGEVCSIPQ